MKKLNTEDLLCHNNNTWDFETMLLCEITKEKGEVKRVVFSIDKSERDKFDYLNRTDKHFVHTLDSMANEMAKKQTTDFMQHPFFMTIPKKKDHMSIHNRGMKQWKDYYEGRVGYL